MSNFIFLKDEFHEFFLAANQTENLVMNDPRAACFRARYCLEIIVHWLYKHDKDLRLPYDTSLGALIHDQSIKNLLPPSLLAKMQAIQRLGNQAAHSPKLIKQYEALTLCKELFHILHFIARTYTNKKDEIIPEEFDQKLIPKAIGQPKETSLAYFKLDIEKFQKELKEKELELSVREEKLKSSNKTLEDREVQLATIDSALAKKREELSAAKIANQKIPDSHNYNEAETRKFIIDLLLEEAGWLSHGNKADVIPEMPVVGMPNDSGEGAVDYVLMGNDGLPLAVVEAKKTSKNAHVGQQQAKLYADCLEKMKGRRPIIFYTNGYDTWVWDDKDYPPRPVQGFYKKSELESLIARRTNRRTLIGQKINETIAGRWYQKQAITKICESFEKKYRKTLLSMATGTGKTRTAAALIDVLTRCNWAKRILFLADRTALVKQAINAFKAHIPDTSPVNLIKEKDGQGRLYASTYSTMLNLIQEVDSGARNFGVGHFDLIIIDEAHRSVYKKFGAIFNYFDALLVGLTATPRDEVHHDTYHVFDLESGVPTDSYTLEQAVAEGFLVPPKAVAHTLKLPSEGIFYVDMTPEEKEKWESLDWGDLGEPPEVVDGSAVNNWLFNDATVDNVLKLLMEKGHKVEGGDKLAKTILFAKNHEHALFIEKRFNINYPHFKGAFARVIDNYENYAESILDDFKDVLKYPQIAISVDMLDTGIDVPEVANLIFFKTVRSKTKFLQMIGRGTRLCPDLFGPGDDKKDFRIFDFCGNFEFFQQNPDGLTGSDSDSLSTKIFKRRVEVLEHIQESKANKEEVLISAVDSEKPEVTTLANLYSFTADLLHRDVCAMTFDNILVRPKRVFVEKYQKRDTWNKINTEKIGELYNHIADLPVEKDLEEPNAKFWDLTCLNLQIAFVTGDPKSAKYQTKIQEACHNLLEKGAIPMVKAKFKYIEFVLTEDFWDAINLPRLEILRLNLRELIQFVDKKERKIIYTSLQDEISIGTEIDLPEINSGINIAQYRKKVEQYIKQNESHIVINKVKTNKPLTPQDLKEIERFLFEAGEAKDIKTLESAFGPQESLTLFIRSLVGLDKAAAKQAFSKFLDKNTYNSTQIQFIDYIIEHLTLKGVMDPSLLYEHPYTGLHYEGIDGVFPGASADEIISIIEQIKANAVA